MAIGRGARSIVVGGDRYRWLATESDRWMEAAWDWKKTLETREIVLVVQHASGSGQKLLAGVPVHQQPIREVQGADGRVELKKPDQATVSPGLVRRIIEYGLRNGWGPTARGDDFIVPDEALRSLL